MAIILKLNIIIYSWCFIFTSFYVVQIETHCKANNVDHSLEKATLVKIWSYDIQLCSWHLPYSTESSDNGSWERMPLCIIHTSMCAGVSPYESEADVRLGRTYYSFTYVWSHLTGTLWPINCTNKIPSLQFWLSHETNIFTLHHWGRLDPTNGLKTGLHVDLPCCHWCILWDKFYETNNNETLYFKCSYL